MLKYCCDKKDHKELENCLRSMELLQFHKNDKNIISKPLSHFIDKEECLFLRLKYLIIRLRRTFIDSDWIHFQNMVIKHNDFFKKNLPSRWKISILDTYADYGNDMERGNALLVSSIFNYERMIQTVTKTYVVKQRQVFSKECHPLWGGTHTLRLYDADTQINLIKRWKYVLGKTPFIYDYFKSIINEMIITKNSTINEMNRIYTKEFIKKLD